MTFDQRVTALPFLGLGVSTEYGAGVSDGALDVMRLRREHPEYASFLEVGVEVAKGLDDDDRAWVADLYGELLHRQPDDGLAYWVSQLGAGVPRQEISHAFYQSAETRQVRVTGLYRSLLERDPDHAGKHHWADVLRDGNDLRLAVHLAGSEEYLARAVSRAR